MFKRLSLCFATLTLSAVWAQDAPKPPAPTFIAADVHVTPADSKDQIFGGLRNDQYEIRGMPLSTLIVQAYGTQLDRVIGGPRRLEIDRYDVIAKVPPGTKQDAIPPMLKALLAERFKLVVKEEKRSLASFVLTLNKGKHKLRPAEGAETRCGTAPGPTSPAPQPGIRLACKGYSTTMLTSILRSLGSPAISAPIADQTGLQGNWDFELEFAPPALMGGGGSLAGMMDAVENQLGLKLEQKQTDQTVFVIESVNTVPTENAPGVAQMMAPPPAPMTLEVATIKPAAAGGPQGGIGIRTDPQGGMVFEGRGMKLSNLVTLAYNLSVDRVVGLPAGIDEQPYDIVAKMSGQPGSALGLTIGPVFQGLLAERFKFVGHLEDRPQDAYKLVAVKPKMAKADPENRASCKTGPAPGAKDPRDVTPGRTLLYTCRNMTAGEIAERLQGMSGGFLRAPVVDATKLEGMWDFTLNFTPQAPTGVVAAGVATGAPAPPPPAGAVGIGAGPTPLATAGDPSDNITFLEAVSSQLGLKLELEKRPMPVLVVEHIEKTPTEN